MTLIEQLERADGPDRELDLAIILSLGTYVLERRGRDKQEWLYRVGSDSNFRFHPSLYSFGHGSLPRYTKSLDAAMTLVPEGWYMRIKQASKYDQSSWTGDGCLAAWSVALIPDNNKCDSFMDYVHGSAATPALALCIAALRARSQGGE